MSRPGAEPTSGGGPPHTVTWGAIQPYFAHRPARQHLVPLPERGLIYVKNSKPGSSTLMVWLDRVHTGEFDHELKRMHRDHRLPPLRDLGRARVLQMLSGQAFRFSFVRDPVRRLESVYRAKMFRDLKFRYRVAPQLGLPPDPDLPVSFEQFLDAVERQDPMTEMNPHWRPQHLNLLHPVVTYDHVGRLESFNAELEVIRRQAGLPKVPVESRNVAPAPPRESVYDRRPDLRRRVEALYAKDMELYGY